jgi:hypothetical protein
MNANRTVKMDPEKSPEFALFSRNQSCEDGESEIGA